MQRRLSYAIKEHGAIRFAVGHWTSPSIPDQVAWGPGALLAHVHGRDDRETGLLNETWCDGAVGMDLDDGRLMFFGGEWLVIHGGLRDAVLALVKESWPGWEVRWAHDGAVDVADMLRLDRRRRWTAPPSSPLPCDEDLHLLEPASAADEQMVVTLCRADGVRHAALELGRDDRIEDLLAGGPAILAALEACAIHPLARERDACSGAVIDPPARQVAYWYSVPQRDRCAELAARWPGWRVERTRGGFRDHVARARLDAEGLWLTRDEVQPFAPCPDVEGERNLADNCAQLLREGYRIVFHPLVEALLGRLDEEEARREGLVSAWLGGFPI